MTTGHTASKDSKSVLDDSRLTITDKEFLHLRDFIHAHSGIALSEHKRALVCSRLAKRLRHYNLQHYSDYYRLLTESDPDGVELVAMINSITTNKTDFFREPHHFQFLAKEVFPAYRNNPKHERPLRLWSAAASTGEEAYSLAMTALESMPCFGDRDICILATDIDTDVLSRAENGIYTQEQAKHIPEALLRRYFLKGQGDHEGEILAKPVLKSLVHFRRLNLQDNPWPMKTPFDVILCRNVLIYFDKPTQLKLFQRMAGMLKTGGYLMLGHSEAIYGLVDYFRPVGHSIYQRRGTTTL
jgi:chemotaxis protein methyltransferase CheR